MLQQVLKLKGGVLDRHEIDSGKATEAVNLRGDGVWSNPGEIRVELLIVGELTLCTRAAEWPERCVISVPTQEEEILVTLPAGGDEYVG